MKQNEKFKASIRSQVYEVLTSGCNTMMLIVTRLGTSRRWRCSQAAPADGH